MITPQDKELLAKKGISEAQIAEQLACFEKGFPYLKLDAAASVEKGILAPATDEQEAYLAAWDAYKNTDKTIVKFVPASGAASRMFKNLFEFLGADYERPTTKFEQAFFEGIDKFAFYDDLNVACRRMAGKDIPGFLRSFGRADDPFPTLLAGAVNIFSFWYEGKEKDGFIRYLTPLECERLMGLPDYWTKFNYLGETNSDNARCTALGNAIALPCAEYIMAGIKEVLEE